MAGVPGRTNNPNGRPPKNRSLSLILEASLGKTLLVDGKRVSGKRVLAELITKAVTTGRVRFPDDTEESVISVKDWIGLAEWVYERVDGKPKQPLTGNDDDRIKVLVEYVNSPYQVTGTPSGTSRNPEKPE